eukprot:SAG31_NODE_5047_length_2778_cov_3.375887_4_plen_159_part_00
MSRGRLRAVGRCRLCVGAQQDMVGIDARLTCALGWTVKSTEAALADAAFATAATAATIARSKILARCPSTRIAIITGAAMQEPVCAMADTLAPTANKHHYLVARPAIATTAPVDMVLVLTAIAVIFTTVLPVAAVPRTIAMHINQVGIQFAIARVEKT